MAAMKTFATTATLVFDHPAGGRADPEESTFQVGQDFPFLFLH
jgi:hypothetical protein